MTNINLTPIEPGDVADASVLMDNLYMLRDAISASEQSVNNKESASNKNAPGGYCGLDNQAHLPEAIKNDVIRATISSIYPVGSIYIGTGSSCPIANLISGSTWVLVGAGKALWTGNGQTSANGGTTTNSNYNNAKANTTIAEGLPNLYGKFRAGTTGNGFCSFFVSNSDVFTTEDTESSFGNVENTGGSSNTSKRIVFNAKNDNSIYGNSSTVQPPAYVVNVWKRTA